MVKKEKVRYSSKPDPVDKVSHRAADDEPQAHRHKAALNLRQPVPQREYYGSGDGYENPAACIAFLLQEPVRDAAIPLHYQIEKRRYHNLLLWQGLKHPDHPELEELICRGCRQRGAAPTAL